MSRQLKLASVLVFIAFLISCQKEASLQKTKNRQLLQIGSAGSAPGHFQEPRGLQILPSGNLLVTDFRNYRIQELNPEGTCIHAWGNQGDLPGQFNDPVAAAMDSEGNLYVVDTWHHKIQKHLVSGEWVESWASTGDFYAPRGIAIDDRNNVYITNTSYHSIKVFDSEGRLKATWGKLGSGLEDFHDPVGITYASDGRLYIADTGNQRIKVMDTAGKSMMTIKVPELEPGKFHESYIAVANDGKIFITLPHLNLVQVYMPDGQLFSRFGEFGSGPEQLYYPTGIALDEAGHVYLNDTLNNRIVKYAPPPPLQAPSTQAQTPGSKALNIARIIIDVMALIIILTHVIRFFRHRFSPQEISVKPHRITAYDRWVESFAQRKRLLILIHILGWLLALMSVLLFYHDYVLEASLSALASTLTIIIFELPHPWKQSVMSDEPGLGKSIFWSLLIILIAFTVSARLYEIKQIPWGLNNDAAWNGMYALRIMDGEKYTPFTGEAWGKETLYMYLISFAFRLFGVGRFTLLIPCLVASCLSVLAWFGLSRLLMGDRFAFISSFIYASMAWNIIFARTGYRAVLAPLCLVLCLWCFFAAISSPRWGWKLLYYCLSGVWVGAGLHTYFSFRGIPFMLILIGLLEWIGHPRYFRKNWWGWIALIACAFFVFLPLFFYAVQNWESFFGRSNFLFVGKTIQDTGSLAPLWQTISKNLLIFHYKATVGNFFNNSWPIVSRLLGLAMLPGAAFFLRHIRTRAGYTMIFIFFFGMLPAVLSEPDAARAIMVPISVSAFAAAGITSIMNYPIFKKMKKIRSAYLVLMIMLLTGSELFFYFKKLGNDYYAQFGYAGKHTTLGYKALELSDDNQIYVSQGHFIDTAKFICYRVPGDVFMITGGEVIDVVPKEKLLENLEAAIESAPEPGKGRAFIFEDTELNKPLFRRVKSRYPGGSFKAYRDPRFGGESVFYTYLIPKELLTNPAQPE